MAVVLNGIGPMIFRWLILVGWLVVTSSGCVHVLDLSSLGDSGEALPRATLEASRNSITWMGYSPDGRHLATVHKLRRPRDTLRSPMVSAPPRVRIWSADRPRQSERAVFELDDRCERACFSADGQLLVQTESGVMFWDLETRQTEKRDIGRVTAFSPDGELVAVSGEDCISVLEISTEKQQATLPLEAGTPIEFSPDGELLATSVSDDDETRLEIVIWNVQSGKEQARFESFRPYWSDCCRFSPDGAMIAARSPKDGILGIWHTASGSLMTEMGEHEGPIWCVAFSPNGQLLASGSEGGQIKVWNVSTGMERGSIVDESTWAVTAIEFSPDGETLTTGDGDGNVKHWDVPDRSMP